MMKRLEQFRTWYDGLANGELVISGQVVQAFITLAFLIPFFVLIAVVPTPFCLIVGAAYAWVLLYVVGINP